jgi:predicted nucleic acid-binding protein
MIVLDTDVVSNLMGPKPSAALIERIGQTPVHQQSTTAITIGELSYGAERVRRPELYRHAMQLLADTRVLPFDRDAAEQYGRLRSQLERGGMRLPDPDLRIAATALAHEAVLITGNVRHFERVDNLVVHNWLTDYERR